MNWYKVFSKSLVGFFFGSAAAVVSNPEAVTTLVGVDNAVRIGAIVALLKGFVNWYKNKDRIPYDNY